jgi:hypothetical protein
LEAATMSPDGMIEAKLWVLALALALALLDGVLVEPLPTLALEQPARAMTVIAAEIVIGTTRRRVAAE